MVGRDAGAGAQESRGIVISIWLAGAIVALAFVAGRWSVGLQMMNSIKRRGHTWEEFMAWFKGDGA